VSDDDNTLTLDLSIDDILYTVNKTVDFLHRNKRIEKMSGEELLIALKVLIKVFEKHNEIPDEMANGFDALANHLIASLEAGTFPEAGILDIQADKEHIVKEAKNNSEILH